MESNDCPQLLSNAMFNDIQKDSYAAPLGWLSVKLRGKVDIDGAVGCLSNNSGRLSQLPQGYVVFTIIIVDWPEDLVGFAKYVA